MKLVRFLEKTERAESGIPSIASFVHLITYVVAVEKFSANYHQL
jgi:hypothetical protein